MLLDRGSIEVTVCISGSRESRNSATATQSPVQSGSLPLSARTVPSATATSHRPRSTRRMRPGAESGGARSVNVFESVAFQPYSVRGVLFSDMVSVSSSAKKCEF